MNNYSQQMNSGIRMGPYQVQLDGVYKELEAGKMKKICASAVYPTAILENMDSHVEKVELTLHKHGAIKRLVVPRSVIASRTSILKLADDGVEVNSDSAAPLMRYFSDVIGGGYMELPFKQAKSVLGWVGDDFLPYAPDYAFDGEDAYKHLYKAVTRCGKLEDWVAYMGPLRGNLALRLVMAAAFASPLVERVGENPFVLHLWGESGTAKTVALMVAVSIWGNPALGQLVKTMNMTSNSMLSTAAFLRNLPFAGDELQVIKSRWGNYDALIMQLTEGVDRGRMSYDKVNETRSWRCSFLFSGEEPITKAESGGGAKNRVIELPCKERIVPNGNEVVGFIRAHYGCAGEPYIKALLAEDAQSLYKLHFSEVLSAADTTDKQAGAAALLLTADDIASSVFWPGEDALKVDDLLPFLASRHEVDVAERAYQFLCDLVAENVANFSGEGRTVWGCLEGDYAFVNRSVLDRELKAAGYDMGAVVGKWLERGYAARGYAGKTRFAKRINGVTTNCIKLRLPDDFEPQSSTDELPI